MLNVIDCRGYAIQLGASSSFGDCESRWNTQTSNDEADEHSIVLSRGGKLERKSLERPVVYCNNGVHQADYHPRLQKVDSMRSTPAKATVLIVVPATRIRLSSNPSPQNTTSS